MGCGPEWGWTPPPKKRWVCRDNRTGKRKRFYTRRQAADLASRLPMGEVFKD